ncbi:MAG: HdeD family acid-resistance protein [Caldilineaceae bacterium]|nr:HdeD family acid-resistance protein [Caldilineaceae bacterium]
MSIYGCEVNTPANSHLLKIDAKTTIDLAAWGKKFKLSTYNSQFRYSDISDIMMLLFYHQNDKEISMSTLSETPQQQMLSELWWMPLVRGILLILFGLFMFAWPGATLISLVVFIGAYWLVGGVFDLVEGIIGHTDRSRMWMILSGIISILAGFFVMGRPIIAGVITGAVWVYITGFMAIVIGVMQIFAGRDGDWSWGGFFLGILSIIFGLIIIFNPLLTEAMLILILPIWAIVAGIFAIVAAFTLRGQASNA